MASLTTHCLLSVFGALLAIDLTEICLEPD